MLILLRLLLVTSVFFSFKLSADSPTVITDQLNRPWSIAFLPDGDFLVTERAGQLRRVTTQGNISPPISGLPDIAAVGQGGLLDVALHPDFINNRWVYLSYVAGNGVRGYSTEVIRGTLVSTPVSSTPEVSNTYESVQTSDRLVNVQRLFVSLPKTKGGRHFGGRLLLARQGEHTYLYLGLGDRGVKTLSQQRDSHHGSLIRLLDDGQVPADNPFVNEPSVKPEIYSYGHRNIQGLAQHSAMGDIWVHEHGPQGGDELNHIKAGANYGWPVITYGVNYGIGTAIGEGTHKPGMEQPHYMWDPSIAPSGLAFYKQRWLVGALKYQLVTVLSANVQTKTSSAPNTLVQQFTEQRFFEGQFGRIRDVRIHGDKLYLLTDSTQGKLIQLSADF